MARSEAEVEALLDQREVLDATCSECEKRGRDTYVLGASCSNCGWSGSVRLSKTHKFDSYKACPVCECNWTLRRLAQEDPS